MPLFAPAQRSTPRTDGSDEVAADADEPPDNTNRKAAQSKTETPTVHTRGTQMLDNTREQPENASTEPVFSKTGVQKPATSGPSLLSQQLNQPAPKQAPRFTCIRFPESEGPRIRFQIGACPKPPGPVGIACSVTSASTAELTSDFSHPSETRPATPSPPASVGHGCRLRSPATSAAPAKSDGSAISSTSPASAPTVSTVEDNHSSEFETASDGGGTALRPSRNAAPDWVCQAAASEFSNATNVVRQCQFHEFAESEVEPETAGPLSATARGAYAGRLTINDTLRREDELRRLACDDDDDDDDELKQEDDEAENGSENHQDEDDGYDDDDEDDDEDDDDNEDSEPGDIVNDSLKNPIDLDVQSDDEGADGDEEDDGDGEGDNDDEEDDVLRKTPLEVVSDLSEDNDVLSDDSFSALADRPTDPVDLPTSRRPVFGPASASRSVPRWRCRWKRPAQASSLCSAGKISPRKLDDNLFSEQPPKFTTERDPLLFDDDDLVCGALDEDKPAEEEYLGRLRDLRRDLQDIDPTFPASDPEAAHDHGLDNSDDDDDDDDDQSGDDNEEHNEASPKLAAVANSLRHPSRSPPPGRRNSIKRTSPPPSRTTSIRRYRSPPPFGRLPRSPPPTRNTSPLWAGHEVPGRDSKHTLAARSVRFASSLPKMGAHCSFRRRASTTATQNPLIGAGNAKTLPRRSAIDIVKGLEARRARRREKLLQKYQLRPESERERERLRERRQCAGKGEVMMRAFALGTGLDGAGGEHVLPQMNHLNYGQNLVPGQSQQRPSRTRPQQQNGFMLSF